MRARTDSGVQHADERQVRTGQLALVLAPRRDGLEFPALAVFEPLAPLPFEVRADELADLVVLALRTPGSAGFRSARAA